VFQEYLEDFYSQFLDIVSTGRKLDRGTTIALSHCAASDCNHVGAS